MIQNILRKNIILSYRLLDAINLNVNLSQDGLFRTELKLFLKSLSSALRGKNVLDVGSGPWNWVRETFGGQCHLTMLDVYPHPSADIVGSVYDLEHIFAEVSRFDVILATELFEHLADPSAALRQIGRVLAPGGLVVLSTPFKKNLHGEEYGDYWRITRQGWQYLLREAGFENSSITWLGEESFPIAYFVRALKPLSQPETKHQERPKP